LLDRIDGHIDPQLITRDIGCPLGNTFGGVAGQAIAGHNIDGNILKQELIQTGTGIADHRHQHSLHSQESYDPNSFGQPVDPQHGLTEHPVQTGEHFDVSSAGNHLNPDLHHHV